MYTSRRHSVFGCTVFYRLYCNVWFLTVLFVYSESSTPKMIWREGGKEGRCPSALFVHSFHTLVVLFFLKIKRKMKTAVSTSNVTLACQRQANYNRYTVENVLIICPLFPHLSCTLFPQKKRKNENGSLHETLICPLYLTKISYTSLSTTGQLL